MTAILPPSSFMLHPSLPPSPRDFEIHRLSSIELLSTRKIAGQFQISQTRVRQIIEEVSSWLAEKLPVATDLDLERGKRFALHLAAAQLRHQVEQLQELWTDSKDTKYLRQQTRCILALARLGVIPGALEALAADAEHQPDAQARDYQPDAPAREHQPDAPAREYKPEAPARDSIPERSAAATDTPLNPKSEICNLKSEIPPFRDCSPKPVPILRPAATPQPVPAPTPSLSTSSDEDFIPDDATLDELNLIEQYLLTQLDRTPSDKPKHRDALNQTLAEVRHKRACVALEISPNTPGVIHCDREALASR